MADVALINAIKELTKAVESQTREMKKVLTAINTNFVEAVRELRPEESNGPTA